MRNSTIMLRMRCAVDGCRPVEFASRFRFTGSLLRASASSRSIIRSMTWIEVLPFPSDTISLAFPGHCAMRQFYMAKPGRTTRPHRTRNPLCYDSRLAALRLKPLLRRLDRVPAYRTAPVHRSKPRHRYAEARRKHANKCRYDSRINGAGPEVTEVFFAQICFPSRCLCVFAVTIQKEPEIKNESRSVRDLP